MRSKKSTKSQPKVNQKRLFLASNNVKLTRAEEEVFFLLTDEREGVLTQKQIAIRRKCSKQAVSKIVRSLKKKGVINKVLQKVDFSQGCSQPKLKVSPNYRDNIQRLHGQEFSIGIIHKDHRYKKIREKCNLIDVDGNTVRLYRDSLEVYSGKSFVGDTAQKAYAKSMPYFQRIFRIIENDLKIIILKPRCQNIKQVKWEFADIDNGIAKKYRNEDGKLKIYGTDDGKLWFHGDFSHNNVEGETTHPETAKEDMDEVISRYLNDWRDNKPPTLSELARVIKSLSDEVKMSSSVNLETASGLNAITKFLETQIKKPERSKVECHGLSGEERDLYIG